MSGARVANVFLGTSEFGAEVLRALASSRHSPLLVVTPPDRPKGRGRKVSSPPTAECARELELPLHQTARVSDPDSTEVVLGTGAELGCVCAFGQLIKEPLLSELPMLNVHPSLLPRWRGAAPIERAIMAGDERTGVCVMRLTEGLDSGPVALSAEVEVGDRAFGELSAELARLGGRLLVRALDLHAAGELDLQEQREEGATYAEKIEASDRRLDPAAPAEELERRVRALSPHIGAYLELEGGDRLRVGAARLAKGGPKAPGEVAVADSSLLVGCATGALAIDRVQPPGKRMMAVDDWLRGHDVPARVRSG